VVISAVPEPRFVAEAALAPEDHLNDFAGCPAQCAGAIPGRALLPKLRRLDADALAAVGTDELDEFLHARSGGVSCTALRTADARTRCRRMKEALRGPRSHLIAE
jgi:hypothetical protein